MEKIDRNSWKRKEIYELFSKVDYPFYSVTLPIDITNAKRVAREEKISLYYLMIWLCTKAINSVPDFRLRIRGGELYRLDETNPSLTDSCEDEDLFKIVTVKWEKDYRSFCQKTKETSRAQTCFLDESKEGDDLIYFSTTPWFDFTALTNEHSFNKDDFIPRLTWGKYYEENGKLMVHLSIEVNHRVIDGKHIAAFKEALDWEMEQFG